MTKVGQAKGWSQREADDVTNILQAAQVFINGVVIVYELNTFLSDLIAPEDES